MPRASFVSFQEIKQRISMAQVLEHYGLSATLKTRGESLAGPCPIHRGTNPSQFRVSLTKNCWNCFKGCGGGNVLDFVAQMEKTDIRQAALLIQQWLGNETAIPQPESTAYRTSDNGSTEPKDNASSPPVSVVLSETPPALRSNPPLHFPGLKNLDHGHEFLVQQAFRVETMEHFGAGYCSKGMMKNRIAIPIHSANGELLAYAGRSVDEGTERQEGQYKYPPNFCQGIDVYNLHRAKASERLKDEGLIIVPDFFDVFRLHEAGFDNAVALMGETMSVEQRLALVEGIGKRQKITLVLPDQAVGLTEFLSQLVGQFFVRLVRVPDHPGHLDLEQLQHVLG